ncbi:hypothetical protein A9P82_01775 [Arachidicoccus ginsenosidimutans]|uniref:hypothetical protein n=1 Tax=Arachidicoccus sp. BS20 TaxID=1850526 RepID=UPI0007F0F230|nr:hypothetical protein [Arachidicoccus sp. BS20]ANI88149.1 hypothetical protein A9P82_01775 [Arachidicoccus sp. BS20]
MNITVNTQNVNQSNNDLNILEKQSNAVLQFNLEKRVAIGVAIWGIASFFLGYYRFFTHIPRLFFGVTVIIILTSLIIIYQYNQTFKNFSNSIPLKAIALFHTWRIFAGWIFLSYSGMLSQTFINCAAYGDIISGFLALAIFIFGHTKLNYYIFDVIGLLDFIIAVGAGITLTITGDNQMLPIVQLPLIMIPLFGVPLSGFTHFISLNRLSKMKNKKLIELVE